MSLLFTSATIDISHHHRTKGGPLKGSAFNEPVVRESSQRQFRHHPGIRGMWYFEGSAES